MEESEVWWTNSVAPPPIQGFVRFASAEEAKAAIERATAAAEDGKVLICGAESVLTVLEGDTSVPIDQVFQRYPTTDDCAA